jgi:hypothetical protein
MDPHHVRGLVEYLNHIGTRLRFVVATAGPLLESELLNQYKFKKRIYRLSGHDERTGPKEVKMEEA